MIIGSVLWTHLSDGSVDLTFKDHMKGSEETRNYKSERGARIAETRFHNRVQKAYSSMVDKRIEIPTPLDEVDE